MEANHGRYLIHVCGYKLGEQLFYSRKKFKFPRNKYNISSYVPDWEVIDGEYHWFEETKGVLNWEAKAKMSLMRLYYPEVTIGFVLPREYEIIEELWGKRIPGWE